MLKVSQRTEYAMRAMIELANRRVRDGDGLVFRLERVPRKATYSGTLTLGGRLLPLFANADLSRLVSRDDDYRVMPAPRT